MNEISRRDFGIFLRRSTVLDRIAFAILAVYIVERLALHWGATPPLRMFVGLLSIAAIVYFVIRMLGWVRERALWSLRNRLIVAYIFMAVVPVLLLLGMIGIAAYLLELQIGAHLLREDLQEHISLISADRNAIAAALEREPGPASVPPRPSPVLPNAGGAATAAIDPALLRPGVASVIAAAQAEWPDLHVYLDHGQRLVGAENGRPFSGLAEERDRLWFASAQALTISGGRTTTLLVVTPLTPALLDSFSSKLGPIRLTLLEPVPKRVRGVLPQLNGAYYVERQQIASTGRVLAPSANWFDLRVAGVATLEALREDPGADIANRLVLAQFSLRPSAVNRDLLTSVGALGPELLKALLAALIVFLVLEVAALATGAVLTHTITRSVADLYNGTLHVRRGDFSHRIRVAQHDQMGALSESFNEMTSSIAGLIEEQRARQRLENEVAIAREVQQQLFPHSMPSVLGLELAAICRPAKVVSGDYYDFISLSPTRVAMALVDISGKGIFAALLMASFQAALRSTAAFDPDLGASEVVARLNWYLFRNTSDDRYATLFYAVYDSDARTLTYTNAGHPAPFLISGGKVQALDQGGTVVGMFEDSRYTQCAIRVSPGSLLVAFSDGLTEPENARAEEYGTERLKAEALRQLDLPVARLAESLVNGAERWAGTAEQADDMTIIVARMT